MKETIFTFWEGDMPEYIKLCLDSWKFPYTMLNYDNLLEYTDIDIERIKRFSLPIIADCVRVHVLRDNGGYWLDADTISITGKLPLESMIGSAIERTNTIGFLHTQRGSEMYQEWAAFQDERIANANPPYRWSLMGNDFTDEYVKQHEDVTIFPVNNAWPETYMIKTGMARSQKYGTFYFDCDYHLSDLRFTDMLMLHNSWTPGWYKLLSREKVLETRCTLSNILKEVVCGT